MFELLLLTAVLGLAAGALLIPKTVSAMISFALMMVMLGIFYIVQEAKLLGLFQIFIYTGGIVVLMLFGITIIGTDFPKMPRRPWTAAVAFGLFVALAVLFLKNALKMPEAVRGAGEDPSLFSVGFSDTVILFALIATGLLYATVRMIDLLRARPRSLEPQGEEDV